MHKQRVSLIYIYIHILDVYWISFGCLLDIFWILFGCLLGVLWVFFLDFFDIYWISFGFLLAVVWMSFGGCGLKVCWISFGFLKLLDSHKKHQELALLVFAVKKQQKVHM